MQATYATSDVPSQNRRHFWQDVVSKTYFPLDLVFPGSRDFHASLGAWSDGSALGIPQCLRMACSTGAANGTS